MTARADLKVYCIYRGKYSTNKIKRSKRKYLCCAMLLPCFLLTFIGYTLPFAATLDEYAATAIGDNGRKGKLMFAHVIFRHGDRMPINPYPNDPWNKPEFWPVGWGQLTNTGKEQHYELGQWLRKRYDCLLNLTYSADDIYIRSTDADRTLTSALSNLAGFYPPTDKEIWNKNIKWQPIPVHTVPEKLDNVVAAKTPCASYEYALSALKNSPEFQKLYDQYAYLFHYLTQFTGSDIDTFEAVQFLNNTLFIETLYNKTLPEWTRKVYPSPEMTHAAEISFSMSTYTRHLARLKVGPLIKEILERFDTKVKGKLKPNRKVWIYSAHDTTIANVLNGLKLFQPHSPPYTACIMLELRIDDNNNAFVSVFYKNTSAEPLPMFIPDCGTACPLSKMFILYKDILPEDWKSECRLSTLMMTYEDANISKAMGILVVIIAVMFLFSYAALIYYRRRNYKSYLSYSQMA